MGKKAPVEKDDAQIGYHFGKPDMERLGLFIEAQGMNGKGYVSPYAHQLNNACLKGSQMYPGGSKSKCAKQDGYFQDKFDRIFEKEAITNITKLNKEARLLNEKRTISTIPFMAPGASKLHACPGDYHGTFGGNVEAFSPIKKKKQPYKAEPPNLLSNPGKKGGPGYPDITLSKYPEHSVEHYEAAKQINLKDAAAGKKAIKFGPMYPPHTPLPFFEPNPFLDLNPGKTYIPPKVKKIPNTGGMWYPPAPAKWEGGCKQGCFDKWPSHSEDRYLSPAEVMKFKQKKTKEIFYPQTWGKTMRTCSIVNNKLDSALHSQNYRTFQPITFPNP